MKTNTINIREAKNSHVYGDARVYHNAYVCGDVTLRAAVPGQHQEITNMKTSTYGIVFTVLAVLSIAITALEIVYDGDYIVFCAVCSAINVIFLIQYLIAIKE